MGTFQVKVNMHKQSYEKMIPLSAILRHNSYKSNGNLGLLGVTFFGQLKNWPVIFVQLFYANEILGQLPQILTGHFTFLHLYSRGCFTTCSD